MYEVCLSSASAAQLCRAERGGPARPSEASGGWQGVRGRVRAAASHPPSDQVDLGPSVNSASMTSSLAPPEGGAPASPSGGTSGPAAAEPAARYSASAILCEDFCSRSNELSKTAASFGSRLFSTVSLASLRAAS